MEPDREQASEGHSGVVHCSPEDCQLGPESIGYCAVADGHAPPANCLLQLRLRAGDAEDPSDWDFEYGDVAAIARLGLRHDEQAEGHPAREEIEGIVSNIFDEPEPEDVGDEVEHSNLYVWGCTDPVLRQFHERGRINRIGRIHIRDSEDD